MLLKTAGDCIPWLADPRSTAFKRLTAFFGTPAPQPKTLVGMDVASMRAAAAEYAYAPRMIEGAFTAPVDCTKRQFQDIYAESARKFIRRAEQEGLELYTGYATPLELIPGQNPAIDPLSGAVLEGQREVIVRAYFTCRKPDLKAGVELPATIFDAFDITKGASQDT